MSLKQSKLGLIILADTPLAITREFLLFFSTETDETRGKRAFRIYTVSRVHGEKNIPRVNGRAHVPLIHSKGISLLSAGPEDGDIEDRERRNGISRLNAHSDGFA